MVSVINLLSLLPTLVSSVAGFKAVQGHYGEYSIVPGFFKQDDPSTNATTFNFRDNFGLHDNLTWPEFKQQIDDLNASAPPNTTYKVIYYGRHAEGFHIQAILKYGGKLWDCYYTMINGDGDIQWGPDALLDDVGIEYAKDNGKFVKSLIPEGFPLPQSFYSSPFTRCADTLIYTWGDIVLDSGYVSPIFKEALRESIGIDTCDQRRSKTYLAEKYPSFSFEANFQEEDLLWKPYEKETVEGKYWRSKQLLDDVFTSDENTFISFTAHADIAVGLLWALGHRPFALSTGAMIPLVVKRESRLDFVPVHADSTVTIPPSLTTSTCPATLSFTPLPSDVGFSTSLVEDGFSITTVTTVVTVTPSPSS